MRTGPELPAAAAAMIVPQGKVLDFIDGSIRNETPEEYVRQEIEKALVRDYQYPRDLMCVEYSIKLGSSRKRVDIAIFPPDLRQDQTTIWAICECKAATTPPNHRTEGIEQLWSYMSACPNVEFGMWTNGIERYCVRKVTEAGVVDRVEVVDLPGFGKDLDDVERPTIASLTAATSDSLLFAFRRSHNYIAGNQGLQKPEAFWELLKLIFCKIADERSGELRFYATSAERKNLNGQQRVKERIGRLFSQVVREYSSIFRENEVIELEPRVLAYIVSQFQTYSLLDSDVDVKGKAYEEIVGSNLRGDRGEFFTPRNVCRMAVQMLDPGPNQIVLDPACGTGGFLVPAMNHVLAKILEAEKRRYRDPDHPSESENRELFRKVNEYLGSRIIGIDLNPNLVKAAKMNMVMNNDGSGGLFKANSLERPVQWPAELRERDLLGKVDILFTNPPFGTRIPVDEPGILEQYDLAHAWDYDEADDRYVMRTPHVVQKSQPPEILFIERCVQLLKPGTGRMAIVLPDAILGAPGLGYVRDWLLHRTRVLASIDLHPDTFQPGNSTQTSLLILQRKSQREIDMDAAAKSIGSYQSFMAVVNHVGHDKRGNPVYVRDLEGNEVVESTTERVRYLHEGQLVVREVESQTKIRDDETPMVAQRFRAWLRTGDS